MRVLYKWKNRLTVVLSGLLLLGGLIAQPQQSHRPPEIPNAEQIEQMVRELTTLLSLTKEQSILISKAYSNHFSEMKVSRGKQGGNRDNHQQMETKRQEFEAEILALLNDDQKPIFDEFLKSHTQKRGHEKPGRK